MLTFLKTAAILLICLVLADVIGVIACLVFEVAPLRGNSAALPYAIWLVLGIFTGFIALNGAGGWIAGSGEEDWSARSDARRIATGAALSGAAVLAALCVLFAVLFWSGGPLRAVYVPDSMPHTLVFFVAVLGAMALGRGLIPGPREGDTTR